MRPGKADEGDPDPPTDGARSDRSRQARHRRAVSRRSIPIRASPDAVFEPVVEAADPEDHPFAALKALKAEPQKAGTRKPKGK